MANTVILGTGIIGVSIAYYLSDHQPGSTVHLVEPSPELFASASGFAAGFLAKDWFSSDVAALGELSFAEHKKLAKRKGGREKWGYTSSISFSHAAVPPMVGASRGDDWLRDGTSRSGAATEVAAFASQAPSWLRRADGDHLEVIGEEGSTAQVDPRRLSEFLLRECLDRGVQLHHPAVALSISTDVRDELASVCIGHTQDSTETDVPCTRLVLAAGAWTPDVFEGLFRQSKLRLPISSLAGHSIVLRSPRWTSESEETLCHAVFRTEEPKYSPEIFSRIGGEIYIAGLNSSSLDLPDLPTKAKVSPAAIETLVSTARELIEARGGKLEVVRESLCFRPITTSGRPMLGRISDAKLDPGVKTRVGAEGGVFVATGHGPWGISLSLGTGKVMAEIIQGRPVSADVSSLAV